MECKPLYVVLKCTCGMRHSVTTEQHERAEALRQGNILAASHEDINRRGKRHSTTLTVEAR